MGLKAEHRTGKPSNGWPLDEPKPLRSAKCWLETLFQQSCEVYNDLSRRLRDSERVWVAMQHNAAAATGVLLLRSATGMPVAKQTVEAVARCNRVICKGVHVVGGGMC
jgi:hypothetical protein